jgi:RNA polymerase primary sigma factor
MNHLLKLGLKTQSTSIIGKHLEGLTFKSDLFQSVFNYCVENKKNKALEYIFENYSIGNYGFLTKDKLSLFNSICEKSFKLSKYAASFNDVVADMDTVFVDDKEEENEFSFEWEAEKEPLAYDGDDTSLKILLQTQDLLLSSVAILSSDFDLLSTIDVTLPTYIQNQKSQSKFILNNKKLLAQFYKKIVYDNQILIGDIQSYINLYFNDLDTTELLHAIDLSFLEMLTKQDINFNNESYSKLKLETYYIHEAQYRFDEWLEYLDLFIEEWRKPKLSNPVYKYYFHMLGKPECHPLVKEDEIKLINSIQILAYQVVSNEFETIFDEIIGSFNDNYENPYILLSEEQQVEIQSAKDINEYISAEIKNENVFLRPISISDYLRDSASDTSLKQLDKIKYLINKFQLSNLRLVVNEANKYRRNYIEFYFDIIQEGNISLFTAINRFDPSKGHKFSTYATWWIKQSISRFIDINFCDVRSPIHYLTRLKQVDKIFREDFFVPSKDTPTNSYIYDLSNKVEFSYLEICEVFNKALWKIDVPIENLLQYEMGELKEDENKDLVSFLFNETQMSDKEAEVIKMRFGINRLDSMTLEEVGVEFGVTRERIRQIESNALKKLRTKVNATFDIAIDNSQTSTSDKTKVKNEKMLRGGDNGSTTKC